MSVEPGIGPNGEIALGKNYWKNEAKVVTHEQDATWVRYGHRERLEIEFDVEVSTKDGLPFLQPEPISGEPCHRIRTIRNISHHEEAHQPAYTYMPQAFFLDVYVKAA